MKITKKELKEMVKQVIEESFEGAIHDSPENKKLTYDDVKKLVEQSDTQENDNLPGRLMDDIHGYILDYVYKMLDDNGIKHDDDTMPPEFYMFWDAIMEYLYTMNREDSY